MMSSLLLFFALSAFATRILHAQTRMTMTNARVGAEGEINGEKVTLPDMPYPYDALEPFIGSETLKIHHGKHHAKYVATTNSMILGTDMENMDVVSILREASPREHIIHDQYRTMTFDCI